MKLWLLTDPSRPGRYLEVVRADTADSAREMAQADDSDECIELTVDGNPGTVAFSMDVPDDF